MANNYNYSAATGVDEFYYGILDPTNNLKIIKSAPERIKFLQEITVSSKQELVKGYGDNGVAEMATSNGEVEVTGQFHKVPHEHLINLLGLETAKSGLFAYGKNDNPPYIAAIFAKTYEDGSKEWVGLPKGKFTRPENKGQTKEDKVEFSSDEISAEFMDREVTGFDDEKSTIFGISTKDDVTQRDEIFQAIFGTPYPGGTTITEPETPSTGDTTEGTTEDQVA